MKTFREFILEAEIRWNTGTLKGSGKSPAQTAKQKQALLNRTAREKPSPAVFNRVSGMKRGISRADTLAKDTDPAPETMDTKARRTGTAHVNDGYAQTGVRGRIGPDSASSVGTVSKNRRRRVTNMRTGQDLGRAEPSDTRASGRFGTVPGGRGTGVSRSGGQIGR